MKTTIELNGYEIVIEENEEGVTVSALQDGDVVEEFSLGLEDSDKDGDSDTDKVKGFEDFEEEEDFESEEEDESDEDELDEESDEDLEDEKSDEPKLELESKLKKQFK